MKIFIIELSRNIHLQLKVEYKLYLCSYIWVRLSMANDLLSLLFDGKFELFSIYN